MEIQVVQQDGWLKVSFDGRPLTCPVCGCQHYEERRFVLNTTTSEFLGLAWADKKATNFICACCGYVFWFSDFEAKKSTLTPKP
jgi:predicted nucleic-acid-binding Zn-ribbon protein